MGGSEGAGATGYALPHRCFRGEVVLSMGCLGLHNRAFNCWGTGAAVGLLLETILGRKLGTVLLSCVPRAVFSFLLPPSAPSGQVTAGAPQTRPREKCLFGGISASLPPWAVWLESGISVHRISPREEQGPGPPTHPGVEASACCEPPWSPVTPGSFSGVLCLGL